MILLVGGTGNLGGRIARHLRQHDLPFRALVRPTSDPGSLAALASDIVRGDLRDPTSLSAAMAGIETVISSAHSLDRIMAGRRDGSIKSVDRDGNANLVAAAASAGVARFVFVSFPGSVLASHTPFAEAKLATEQLLRESRLREVIVRPDAYQEVWLSTERGFDWRSGTVTIFGDGTGVAAYISMEDVAEALVRLAELDDPPRLVELGGPEGMTQHQLVETFERALRHRLKVRRVPRFVLRAGSVALRRFRPEIASVMGMTLFSDSRRRATLDDALRELGIQGRPVSAYIGELVAEEREEPTRG